MDLTRVALFTFVGTMASLSLQPAPAAPGVPPVPRAVSGRVLDRPGGKPVEGVQVLVQDVEERTAKTQTDREGGYSFTVAPYRFPYQLSVAAPKQATWTEGVFVRVENADIRVEDLVLARPQSITGTVRDSGGRPVAGADIVLSSDDPPKLGCMTRTHTDERGNYRFYLTPRTVEVRCGGTQDRYAETRTRKVTLAAGQHLTGVDFEVKSAPPFHGQVLLPNGQPAGQAEIDVVLTDVTGKSRAGGDGMVGDGTRRFHMRADDQGQFTGYLLGPWSCACEGKVTLKFMAQLADRAMLATAKAETMADAAPLQVKIVLAPAAGAPGKSPPPATQGEAPQGKTTSQPSDLRDNNAARAIAWARTAETIVLVERRPDGRGFQAKSTLKSGLGWVPPDRDVPAEQTQWLSFSRLRGDPKYLVVPCDDKLVEQVRQAIPLPTEWSADVSGLVAGLRMEQDRFSLGSMFQVPANLVIRNVSDKPIKLPDIVAERWLSSLTAGVSSADGRLIRLSNEQLQGKSFPTTPITLAPKESLNAVLMINGWHEPYFHDWPDRTWPREEYRGPFETAGEYIVRLRCQIHPSNLIGGPPPDGWHGELVTPPAKFTILRPPPASQVDDGALSGSNNSIDLVGKTASVAFAAEALEPPDSEHHDEGWNAVRQDFRVLQLLGGAGAAAGQVASLRYFWFRNDKLTERPIRKGERVIWLGVGSPAAGYQVSKAVEDTPDNRQAVRQATPPAATQPNDPITRARDANFICLLRREKDNPRVAVASILKDCERKPFDLLVNLWAWPASESRWLVFSRRVDLLERTWACAADDSLVRDVQSAIPKPAYWSKPVEGLTLGLRPHRERFDLDIREGVDIEMFLQNVSSRPVSVLEHRFDRFYPWSSFDVTTPGGKKFHLTQPVREAMDQTVRVRKLEPGESYIYVVSPRYWAFDKNPEPYGTPFPRNVFTRPGSYTLVGHYSVARSGGAIAAPKEVWTGELTSPPISFDMFRTNASMLRPGSQPNSTQPLLDDDATPDAPTSPAVRENGIWHMVARRLPWFVSGLALLLAAWIIVKKRNRRRGGLL